MPASGEVEVLDELRNLYASTLGYPVEVISPDADLEADFRDSPSVGGAFLDRRQIRDVCQLGELRRCDVHRVADRVVVKHPGQPR